MPGLDFRHLFTAANGIGIVWTVAILVGAVVAGLIIDAVVELVLSRWRRQQITFRGMTLPVELWSGPLRALIPAVCLLLATYALRVRVPPPEPLVLAGLNVVWRLAILWIIAAGAWLAVRSVRLVREMIISQYPAVSEDNVLARRMSTQVRVIEQILTVVIVFVAIAAGLMSFDTLRQLGVSMLASAGIAGIVVGLAAQRSLSTLFAGIQIAFSQPIRLDDRVVVEGESGTIEEITLTYVVVRIWDQRRLIVPITQFIEKPFQNWTRSQSKLLGTVLIYTDYRVPVQEIREELMRILESTPLWNREVGALQVTSATDRALELRALLSANNAPEAWDLRCLVREKLVEYLQKNHPASLPRVRLDVEQAGGPGESVAQTP